MTKDEFNKLIKAFKS